MLNALFRVVAAVSTILGAHGLYVHFSRLETVSRFVFGSQKDMNKLFLVVDLPDFADKYIGWMTVKGFESWFVPAVFAVGGVLLWLNSRKLADSIRSAL